MADGAFKLEDQGNSNSADFARALIDGLSRRQKSIPCQYLYDARGSDLFEQITHLDAYYPTRAETAILKAHAGKITAGTPAGAALVEFGSGSSVKTEILLGALDKLDSYVPIDISRAALDDAKARLNERFPKLNVLPVEGDFGAPLKLPPRIRERHKLGFFPGSTIGNLTHENAIALLANMASILGPSARLIIGADLRKDEGRLVTAYDDPQGVTAAFNLNLLARANRELDADFDLDRFQHLAVYNRDKGRIEIYIVSKRDQVATILGRTFRFGKGERVHTEYSHKYTITGFQDLAARAGWRALNVWTDAQQLFSVHELRASS